MNATTQTLKALLINVLLALAVVAAVFAAIGGGWSIAKYTGILPLKKAKKALTIDNTPVSVETVKAIGELVTATYYDETVVIAKQTWEKIKKGSSTGKDTTVFSIVRIPESKADGKNELVIVQKAHARIGVDFDEMGENDLVIGKTGESVEITLPALKCLDFIMNPSDTEVFSENGTWNLDDLKAVMSPAREEIEAKMNEDKDLFANARKGAEEVVTQLLETLGYTNVVVRHKPDGPVKLPSPKAGN